MDCRDSVDHVVFFTIFELRNHNLFFSVKTEKHPLKPTFSSVCKGINKPKRLTEHISCFLMVGAKNPLLQVWLIVKSPLFHFDWHFQSENVDSVELGIFDSEIILTRQSREMLTGNTCLPSTAGCHVYSMHT